MSIVTPKCVKSRISNKPVVRQLKKADFKPTVQIYHNGQNNKGRCYLATTRYGNTETLPISKRVAEELIALGFDYGN